MGILCMFIILGCDPTDERLTIFNRSNNIVFYRVSLQERLHGESPYKNSFRLIGTDTLWDETSNLILPNSYKKPVAIGRKGWENLIKDAEDQKLRIFVFEKDLLLTLPWDSIVNHQIFSQKYELTLEDMDLANWEIIYEK